LLVAGAAGWGCASEQIPEYGDPGQVAGGVGGGSDGSTTTGPPCNVDPACAVKFATDVFPALDTTAKCATGATCHGTSGTSPGGFTVEAGNPDSYYDVLTTFVIEAGGAYIVKCDPDNSKMLCNLKVTSGDTNPHGACGKVTMPVAPADALTLAQLTAIEDWIACGAPNN
jgi:hypothetical protein